MSSMLDEAKRLYLLGFAVHWLKPKSKMPVKAGWTTGPRAKWVDFRSDWDVKFNLGVRLGTASKLTDGMFLGVIDCDVKSTDKKHFEEMLTALEDLFLPDKPPFVVSGRGNGSMHLYIKSKEPLRPRRVVQSSEKVEVFMPSVAPSKHEEKVLAPGFLKKGIRLRPAWEISIMGEGQQVVLPPSIHPDSGKAYHWGDRTLETVAEIPLFKDIGANVVTLPDGVEVITENIKFEPVDLELSGIPGDILSMIVDGTGVEDRSAALFQCVRVLNNMGFDDAEIMSIFTDRENFLGQVAYDHAKTKSRKRAAEWVQKFTMRKVKKKLSAEAAFEDAVVEEPVMLSKEESAKQIAGELGGDWRKKISRTDGGKGKPQSTFANVKLILTEHMKEIGFDCFIARDLFALRDMWTCDCPWGAKKGEIVRDHDPIMIKEWLASNFSGLEAGTNVIDEVLISQAVRNGHHPVKDYLCGLEWDGIPRLDGWLSEYLGAVGPVEYVEAIGRKVLVAAVARIFSPGVKFDHVLILEGLQGIMKSTAVEALGAPWYSDAALNPADKDAVVNIQGVWFYELGELHALRKGEVEFIKAYITRRVDKIRLPYGSRTEQLPRQGIFIGTTNSDGYLRDVTGNRRFWPVSISNVKIDQLKSDRDQLFAEAVSIYRRGQETLYIESGSELDRVVKFQQAKRMGVSAIDEAVADFLKSGKFESELFRTSDLMSAMIDDANNFVTNTNRGTQMEVNEALKKLGFTQAHTKLKSVPGRYWKRKPTTGC